MALSAEHTSSYSEILEPVIVPREGVLTGGVQQDVPALESTAPSPSAFISSSTPAVLRSALVYDASRGSLRYLPSSIPWRTGSDYWARTVNGIRSDIRGSGGYCGVRTSPQEVPASELTSYLTGLKYRYGGLEHRLNGLQTLHGQRDAALSQQQIGRASGREKGKISVVAGS
eukprot:RCo003135